MIGKIIGKYRIIGQLGRGGMGTVYKAVDEVLDREVAIKVLNADLADTEMMERFRAEAITLAKLNHPEIATIYELFRADAELLMVMEFVRGETLDKISDRMGALPPESAVYLIDKVLSALEHAHRAGIVHRDMKPANVMVTEHGGVKIMDFGVARVRGFEHAEGYLMGTPAYMPPEQVLGQEVDGRADLYSVGVIFYRLLTGTLPFNADTAIDMMQKQISDAPTPLRVHREGLPDWCETTLQRALAKLPADRFQTAEEFRETLGKATGMVTMELTKAFSISIAEPEMTTSPQPDVLERFGLTPVWQAAGQIPFPVAPNPTVSTTGSAPGAGGAPPAPRSADPLAGVAKGPTVVLPRTHPALTGWLLAILAGGMMVLAIVALRRPAVAPTTATANVPRPAIQNTTRPTSEPHGGTSPAPATGHPMAPAAVTVGTTSAQASATMPAAPGAPPRRGAARTSTLPGSARGSPQTASDLTATLSARTAPVEPAGKTFAVPIVFDARALVRDGDRQRERECQVVLADGKINIQANDDHNLLHAVPYDGVLSISYSRGRDPLWNAPEGPTRVARAGGGALGIFRGARHWVSLRTKDASDEFVVLRLGNDAQARRAIIVLEERTGRTAQLVVEGKDDK